MNIRTYLHDLRRPKNFSLHARIMGLVTSPLTKILLRRNPDPDVLVDLRGRRMWINWSHQLPFILDTNPNYELEIGRLARYLHEKIGPLRMVDVGANVGDTIAALPELPGAAFLCVEASSRYYSLLHRNLGSIPSVLCIHALVTDGAAEVGGMRLEEDSGSGHLSRVGTIAKPTVKAATLDSIVSTNPQFGRPNFLKIDTDGFDYRVLAGACRILSDMQPVLHFELCFRLWEEVGGTDVGSALHDLASIGYEQAILYDNLGYLIGTDSLSDQSVFRLFRDYAARRRDFYLNVIAFPASNGLAEEFLQRELRHTFL